MMKKKKIFIALTLAFIVSLSASFAALFEYNIVTAETNAKESYLRIEDENSKNSEIVLSLGGTGDGVSSTVLPGDSVSAKGLKIAQASTRNIIVEVSLVKETERGYIKIFGYNLSGIVVKYVTTDSDSGTVIVKETNPPVSSSGGTNYTFNAYQFAKNMFKTGTSTLKIIIENPSNVDAYISSFSALSSDFSICGDRENLMPGQSGEGKIIYQGDNANIYWSNGNEPYLHLVGPTVFETYVSADAVKITPIFTTAGSGGNLSIKSGGGLSGDPNGYDIVGASGAVSGTSYDISTLAIETNASGQQFKRIQFMAWAGQSNYFISSLEYRLEYPAASNPTGEIFFNTNSLTAKSSDLAGKILSYSGAQIVDEKDIANQNIGKVVELTNGDSLIFEYQLDKAATGGKFGFWGNNLKNVKAGIYIQGYAQNDGFYTLDCSIPGGSLEGIGAAAYGFGNTSWFDAEKKIIRVKLWVDTNHTISIANTVVSTKPDALIDSELNLSPYTKDVSKYMLYQSSLSVYMDNGVNPWVRLGSGNLIYQFFVPAEFNGLNIAARIHGDAYAGVRNANAGAVAPASDASYMPVSNNIDIENYTVIDPNGVASSGDEYKVIQIAFGGKGGEQYFKGVTIIPFVKDRESGFDRIINTNNKLPIDESYIYFNAGDSNEEKYKVNSSSENFDNTNSGIFNDKNNGGAFNYLNARKIRESEFALYEFDLPAHMDTATLKIFATQNIKMTVESDESYFRKVINSSSIMDSNSRGLMIYNLSIDDAFKTADRKFRIRISGAGSGDISLYSVMVQTLESEDLLNESIQLSNLTENAMKFAKANNGDNLYYINGTMPSYLLASGKYITYKFTVPSHVSSINIAMSGSGLIGLEYKGNNLLVINKKQDGLCETRIATINTSVEKTIELKVMGGSGILRYLNVAIAKANSANYELSTFTPSEYEYISNVSTTGQGGDTAIGYVGIAHSSVSENARRIGYDSAVKKPYIDYKFTFNTADLFKNGDKNSLFVILNILKGTYEISVSNDVNFNSDDSKTIRLAGNLTISSRPKIDASKILTGAVDMGGIKTIYVRVSHNNTIADDYMGGGMDLVFNKISIFTDGTTGRAWPNDSDFDYNGQTNYEKWDGLDQLPQEPEPTTGVDEFDKTGNTTGCGAVVFGNNNGGGTMMMVMFILTVLACASIGHSRKRNGGNK